MTIGKEAYGQSNERGKRQDKKAEIFETRPFTSMQTPASAQPSPMYDGRRPAQAHFPTNSQRSMYFNKNPQSRDLTVDIDTQKLPASENHVPIMELPTTPMTAIRSGTVQGRWEFKMTRGRAFFLALLLLIVILNVSATGFSQFFGPQGWSLAFGSSGGGNQNLLNQISQKLRQHTPTPGSRTSPTPTEPMSDQVVNALMSSMTLDQKIGQMLMVRIDSTDSVINYASELDAMLTQYHVGSVIEYQADIYSQSQLIQLNQQIQAHAELPVIISIDQEGGTVDRLAALDGPETSAETIGASGDPNQAYQQGLKDGQTLASYGFNLNLAPVVDVTNVPNDQLAGRTYGNNATIVTQMAGEYLKGLQQSGKVLGTIKHFPGLGDTSTDPHTGLPDLTRSLADLNAIDWAPYKQLIAQGDVYSVMVTHEMVQSVDPGLPSSLSPKIINILRNQLGFKGVIITDGLTMDAITNLYSLGDAAALAVEAGDDLLMDPRSPDEVAQMIDGIKQALNSGKITQARIDQSVRRILLFKYQMGLLKVHS